MSKQDLGGTERAPHLMEPTSPYRPRVSRETRLLLTAGALALAALWLLARIRFRDLPVTPNPVPAVLSQLASGFRYDDLTAEIGQLQTRLEASSLITLGPVSASPGTVQTPRLAALRLRGDIAVTVLPADSNLAHWTGADLVARDPPSGLAVVRVPQQTTVSPPAEWVPRRLQQPRYFVATDVTSRGVSLRPVFVGALDAIDSPLWPQPLWAVPAHDDLAPGSFLFTGDAELAGVVIAHAGKPAIVPTATLLVEADRLLQKPNTPTGAIGVEVQALTAPLASLTGASVGAIVTWVEREGSAAGQVMVGDVIEAIDGRPLTTRQLWDVRLARLSAGEKVTLLLRRDGEVRAIVLTATAETAPVRRSLGLTLRGRAGIGAEVVRVELSSAADRAGLSAGDMITLVGEVSAPSPAQIARSFATASQGQHVMLAVTRGDAHSVTTLER